MLQKSPNLADIPGKESLLEIQNSIAKAAGVSVFILDANGAPVTEITSPGELCALREGFQGGSAPCGDIIHTLFHTAHKSRKPASSICPVSGMRSVAIPIFCDDKFFGVWMIGQARFHSDSIKPLEKAARSAGIDYTRASKHFESVPALTLPEFEMITGLITIVSGEIVRLSFLNIEAVEKNRRLSELSGSLEHSLSSLRIFADTPDVFMSLTDFNTGEILMCNNAYAACFGKTANELSGTYCFKNMGFQARCPFCPRDRLLSENDEPLPSHTWESYFPHRDAYLQVTSRALRFVDGRLALMSSAVDISRRKKLETELYERAFIDRTLQLPNTARMEQDIREGRRYHALIAVTLTDLEQIRDVFGRAAGDALLCAARDYILELILPHGAVYRGKFSDFSILLKSAESEGNLSEKIAKSIFRRFEKPWKIFSGDRFQNLSTTANICVVPLGEYHEHFFSCLQCALELGMDAARESNEVVICRRDDGEILRAEEKLDCSLKNATAENMRGFSVVYQPIVDINSATWQGLEALCRWECPEIGPVPPNVFVPVAEANGLIHSIGLWVLEQALFDTHSLGLHRLDGFLLQVNLSPVQLTSTNFARTVLRLLQKHNYPPEKLGLEITGYARLNFSKQMLSAVKRLHGYGISVILDDFGIRGASFSLLHKLPAKVLKTDRAFISRTEYDVRTQGFFCAMVSLAGIFQVQLVAKGVENNSQVQVLANRGAVLFQGCFFSHPLTAARLSKKLDRFYRPEKELLSLKRAGQEPPTDPKYEEPDAVPEEHSLIKECLSDLMANPDGKNAVDMLLEQIGKSLGLSRSYVFLKGPDGTYSNTNEWCAEGVLPEKRFMLHIPVEQMYPKWGEALKRDGLLSAKDIHELKSGIPGLPNSGRLHSAVALPVWIGRELHGFVGFDEYDTAPGRALSEMRVLHSVTNLISFVLEKTRLKNEVSFLNRAREDVLNNIDAAVYVSDLETNEILFANTALCRMYDYVPLKGRLCFEALHGRNERCPSCPVPYLLKNPGKSQFWEFPNQTLEARFRARDSIIFWSGERLAHFEYAVEISNPSKEKKSG